MFSLVTPGADNAPAPIAAPASSTALDVQCVEQTRAGNMEAYSELVARYEGKIYRHVYRMVRQAEDAEDLTQDIFLKAFEKLDQYQTRFAFQTWLYRIATNTTLSYLRRAENTRRARLEDPESYMDRVPEESASSVDQLVKQDDDHQLHVALNQLKPNDRLLITLFYFDELPLEQIAEIQKKSVNSQTVALHRARNRLKKVLEKFQTEEEKNHPSERSSS
jgi:RNA polymerase sigma-70 factor (ECF subfamily)